MIDTFSLPNSLSKRSTKQFLIDVQNAAIAAGVTPENKSIAEGFAPFADFFCNSSVEFRTTSKSVQKRECSFRFVHFSSDSEIWSMASKWFHLDGLPFEFMDSIHKNFSLAAEGIDADARTGFHKVWAFLLEPCSLEHLLILESLPTGITKVIPTLKNYQLETISIIGVDYYNNTCNIYQVLPSGWINKKRIQSLLEILGFSEIENEWFIDIESYDSINLTFSWNSDIVERVAFYHVVDILDKIPNNSVLQKFAIECPIVVSKREFIHSIAFSHNEHYHKIEVDYDGTITDMYRNIVRNFQKLLN